jgi:hypothetical protein
VDRHYFDRVIPVTASTLFNAVFPGQYGPFDLFAPPENVVRSIVRRVAVVGSPSMYFRTRFYWTLVISTGSVQEFLVDTVQIQTQGLEPAQVAPGIRYTPFGWLDEPQTVDILVKQGSRLQLIIYGGDPVFNADNPNCIVRLQGLNEFGRVDA